MAKRAKITPTVAASRLLARLDDSNVITVVPEGKLLVLHLRYKNEADYPKVWEGYTVVKRITGPPGHAGGKKTDT